MELALDEAFRCHHNTAAGVSILVFVELALDACLGHRGQASWMVSILVFVELALDEYASRRDLTMSRFQSLFSWNLLLMVCREF